MGQCLPPKLLGGANDGCGYEANEAEGDLRYVEGSLGAISVILATIIIAAKQLQWETLAHQHGETAMHYAEQARMINSERTLARIVDIGFASVGDLVKKVQEELDRFEESAPAVPGFLKAKLGPPALSPRNSNV